jgi:hypothetical protein
MVEALLMALLVLVALVAGVVSLLAARRMTKG